MRQGADPSDPDGESSSSAEKAHETDDGENEDHDDDDEQPTNEDAPPITGPPRVGSLEPVLLPLGSGVKRWPASDRCPSLEPFRQLS